MSEAPGSLDISKFVLRQLIMEEIGAEGQRRLEEARVLIVGLGGLGGTVAQYLARAGVGRLTMLDSDVVEPGNLNRQVLFNPCGVGKRKAELALARVLEIGLQREVRSLDLHLSSENASAVVRDFDLVVDCLDNFPSRLALASAAWQEGVGLVHGACRGFEGRVSFQIPGATPCLHCFLGPHPMQLTPVPVLGAVAGVVATLQATEALKVLLGLPSPLAGKVLLADLKTISFKTIAIGRRPACAVCGGVQEVG
jgi:adenylyltransferase/sulfurtransferase